ncbi:MAG TPA: hypothetical protein VM779_06660 [Thermoanaerobaculia bacterium]|nr:hypothetical protein [Thermoanaerobaculia bacterium]
MARRDTHEARNRVRAARADVHADLVELDDKLHHDVAQKIRNRALLIAGGAAALGVILGVGGAKGVRLLLAIGIPAAAVAVYLRRDSARP